MNAVRMVSTQKTYDYPQRACTARVTLLAYTCAEHLMHQGFHFNATVVFFLLELKDFLNHVTGTTAVFKESIKIDFDDIGAISAHTCSNLLVFPRGAFVDTQESYSLFKMAMKSFISAPLTFNLA